MVVAGLWKSLTGRAGPKTYKLARLVDRRRFEAYGMGGRQIICDIDKTYLETEFESLLRMARIAFEAAAAKVTVAGASDVLVLARWEEPDQELPSGAALPRPLHFVSSSPPQLRAVLEEKLMMDGLDWSSDTFKNQAYNLRMGRMDLLRQHVAYKSRAILSIVAEAGPGGSFTLIGDNAESDAYIYQGVQLFLARRLSAPAYRTWLTIAGVEETVAHDVTSDLQIPDGTQIEGILIRNVPGYHFVHEAPLTDPVMTFDNFYQAALLLMIQGLVAPSMLWGLTRRFHNHHGMTLKELAGMLSQVRAADVGSAETKAAVATAMARLAAPADPDAGKAMAPSLVRDLSRHNAMAEGELLAHARLWMQRIAAEKGR